MHEIYKPIKTIAESSHSSIIQVQNRENNEIFVAKMCPKTPHSTPKNKPSRLEMQQSVENIQFLEKEA